MVVYLNELHKCKSSSPLDLCLNFPQMGGKFSYIQTNEFEYRGVELKFYLIKLSLVCCVINPFLKLYLFFKL